MYHTGCGSAMPNLKTKFLFVIALTFRYIYNRSAIYTIDVMSHMLKVKNVNDYSAYLGHSAQHRWVSVIDYAEVTPIRHSLCNYSVYGLFLRDDILIDLTYGLGKYDYNKGTLICVAPGQIGGKEDNGERVEIEGWALLFHPDILRGSPLENKIKEYSFFSYQTNEALHMTGEEREIFISMLQQLRHELGHRPDKQQDSIILSYIELILNYAKRFYDRQFMTRRQDNNDILARFEKLLDDYYNNGKQLSNGIPSVLYCAEQLCMSSNYFGDLVKRTTGETAGNHIRRFIVEKTKDKLIGGNSISQIAYDLGFEYPQHLSRLFKKQEGCTPTEYTERLQKNSTTSGSDRPHRQS